MRLLAQLSLSTGGGARVVRCRLRAEKNKLFLTSMKRPDKEGTEKTEAIYEGFYCTIVRGRYGLSEHTH